MSDYIPHNFWDYGINPIVGYRISGNQRQKTIKPEYVSTTTK